MPHNQPSPWGPLPYDERDLDAVLSGDTDGIAVGLRPVARALAPLRAGPSPGELSGETVARAAYRAFAVVGENEPAGPQTWVLPPATTPWPGQRPLDRRPLDRGPLDRGHRRGHRHRRKTGTGALTIVRLGAGVGVSWVAIAVVGCAAAAAAVVGVAVSGGLSGSSSPRGQQPGIAVSSPAAGPAGTASQRVDGRAHTEPSVKPKANPVASPQATGATTPSSSPSPSAGGDAQLCRSYYAFNPQQASGPAWMAEIKALTDLSKLAGNVLKISGYCQEAGVTPPAHPSWRPTGSVPGSGPGSGYGSTGGAGFPGGSGHPGGLGIPGGVGGSGAPSASPTASAWPTRSAAPASGTSGISGTEASAKT